jgi:hypothetical protein
VRGDGVIAPDTERDLLVLLELSMNLNAQYQQLAADRQIEHAAFSQMSSWVSEASGRFGRLEVAVERLALSQTKLPQCRVNGQAQYQNLDDAILGALAKRSLSMPKVIQAVLDVSDVRRQ